jgi:CBS domain-containing protein/uncharacterized membrane protein YuzA (DUF378 family)
MLRNVDRAMKALLIVGGINWLTVAAGKADFVALATRRRFGTPSIATRTIYGLVGGAALYTLSRWIQEEAFSGGKDVSGRRVREAMTPNPISVQASATVLEAATVLRAEEVGAVPVVEGDRLVGIVTDRDLAIRVIADGRDPSSTTIREIASRNPETVNAEQDLGEALRLMARHQVRRLPVVEGDRLVGMLAQADIAQEVPAEHTGRMVEDISR